MLTNLPGHSGRLFCPIPGRSPVVGQQTDSETSQVPPGVGTFRETKQKTNKQTNKQWNRERHTDTQTHRQSIVHPFVRSLCLVYSISFPGIDLLVFMFIFSWLTCESALIAYSFGFCFFCFIFVLFLANRYFSPNNTFRWETPVTCQIRSLPVKLSWVRSDLGDNLLEHLALEVIMSSNLKIHSN